MTRRERFLSFAGFEPVYRVPRHALFVDDQRRTLASHLGQDPFAHFDMDNGCGHMWRGFYHFTEYISPLRNAERLEEIEAYPFPKKATWLDDKLISAAEEAHTAGDCAWVFAGHIYQNAWQVRGYDQFCQNSFHVAIAAAKAGYDCIMTGDDVQPRSVA